MDRLLAAHEALIQNQQKLISLYGEQHGKGKYNMLLQSNNKPIPLMDCRPVTPKFNPRLPMHQRLGTQNFNRPTRASHPYMVKAKHTGPTKQKQHKEEPIWTRREGRHERRPWNSNDYVRVMEFESYPVRAEYAILGDSLVKNIINVPNTIVISYPGICLEKMAALVKAGKIPELRDLKMIIVHCGTNDIDDGLSYDQLMEDSLKVARELFNYNKDAQIIFSQVLPRPFDRHYSDRRIRKYTRGLSQNCHKWGGASFAGNRTRFTRGPQIKYDLYCPDGLHLSDEGVEKLNEFFCETVEEYRAKLKLPLVNTNDHGVIVRKFPKQQ
jgi:lysophospholipase L1-like esterase